MITRVTTVIFVSPFSNASSYPCRRQMRAGAAKKEKERATRVNTQNLHVITVSNKNGRASREVQPYLQSIAELACTKGGRERAGDGKQQATRAEVRRYRVSRTCMHFSFCSSVLCALEYVTHLCVSLVSQCVEKGQLQQRYLLCGRKTAAGPSE